MANRTLFVVVALVLVSFVFADNQKDSSYCNTPCYNNDECYSNLCSQCSIPPGESRGTCIPGLECGSSCSVDTDCDQLSPCKVCSTDGICTPAIQGCGTACDDNSDCPTEKCSYCHWPGICVPGGECNSRCEVDSDCNRISNCRNCINNECVAKCGNACEHNDQCEDGCHLCWGGFCISEAPSSPPPSGGGDDDDDDGSCDDSDTFIEVIVRVPKSAACYNNNYGN